MNDTTITVVGRLVADPVIRPTSTGTAMATFRIATNSRRQVSGAPGQYADGPTSYYSVSAFRSLGANSAACLKKGQSVVVTGTLDLKEFTRQDGSIGLAGEITARAVGPDLNWGVSHFTKVVRGGGGESVAGDPHLRAALSAMAEPIHAVSQDPEAIPYDVDGDVPAFDPITGEVREDGHDESFDDGLKDGLEDRRSVA